MHNKIRIGTIIFAAIGLLDSIYLTWSKLAQRAVFCGGSNQCETVNSSVYSEIWGIPIAVLGVGSYLLILVLLILESRGGIWRGSGPLVVFGLSLVGVIYSIYLTYIEIAVLKAICPYCVVSAIVVTGIFILTLVRVVDVQTDVDPIRSRGVKNA